jgi:SAM-dependent methyltransferase
MLPKALNRLLPKPLKRLIRRTLDAALSACPIVFHFIKVPYWWIIRGIITYWGERGLHSMAVGEFVGGDWKTRSLYREDMILRTVLLFVYTRNRSCLDLACNDGFWSFRLARFGLGRKTGIDRDKDLITKANFLKQVYDFPSSEFRQQDIFDFLRGSDRASFDIILLLGVLYHLPEQTNWSEFFSAIARINNEALVIDSRWFEDDDYWYDKTSNQAVIRSNLGQIRKWRPVRNEVFGYLYASGYEKILEVNPSAFLSNLEEARGNADPYTFENVCDYITGNRTIIIAYRKKAGMPNILNKLAVKHVT